MGERRKRISWECSASFLSDLELLPFVVDEQPHEGTILDFARQHTLTVYDAAYLELGQRRNVATATLIKAAKQADVAVFAIKLKKPKKRA